MKNTNLIKSCHTLYTIKEYTDLRMNETDSGKAI